ncbi:DUF2007 domain-containing protein [bacterium]|nr:DUF2007 domain-containing protein [bacterium]
MPRLTSPPPKKSEEWVPVASFLGLEADGEADACVALLQGSDIPAVRLPTNNIATLGGLGVTISQPVLVLVPPDWEDAAKELLEQDAV